MFYQLRAELVICLVFLEGGEDFFLCEIFGHFLHHPLFISQSELHGNLQSISFCGFMSAANRTLQTPINFQVVD